MGNAIIFTNPMIMVGTGSASADRDISDRTRKITWTEEFEDHDVTCFGSSTRAHALGMADCKLDLEVMQSYGTADGGENIDNLLSTLRDISATGKKFLVKFRPSNACATGTNPQYTMLAIMSKRNIVDGEVGAALTNPISLMSAGDMTRATSS